MNLANELRQRGVKVVEVKGWTSRRANGSFTPIGIVNHHTGGTNSLGYIITGSSQVPGPLSQFLIHKNGTVYLISNGRANHAGIGSSVVLNETRNNIAPDGDAYTRGLRDDTYGNQYYWGIEVENTGGSYDPYPLEQIDQLVKLNAALCHIFNYHPNTCIHHREWTRRKSDMSYRIDLRPMIANRLDQLNGATPIPDQRRYSMLIYGRRGTPDYSAAAAIIDAANRGVATSSKTEAQAAVARGELVIAVGGGAAKDLGFEYTVDKEWRSGNKISCVGSTGLNSVILLGQIVRAL